MSLGSATDSASINKRGKRSEKILDVNLRDLHTYAHMHAFTHICNHTTRDYANMHVHHTHTHVKIK